MSNLKHLSLEELKEAKQVCQTLISQKESYLEFLKRTSYFLETKEISMTKSIISGQNVRLRWIKKIYRREGEVMISKYQCGQVVVIERIAIANDDMLGEVSIKKEIEVTIVGVIRNSNSEKVYYSYLVTNDPCQAHYSGKRPIPITEDKILKVVK